MRELLSGTEALQFAVSAEDAGRYGWIEEVLRRIRYRSLPRPSRGIVLAYLQRFSGYRRAQVTRLVSRWVGRQALVKRYCAPDHGFARHYTGVDVGLLAEVDRTRAAYYLRLAVAGLEIIRFFTQFRGTRRGF